MEKPFRSHFINKLKFLKPRRLQAINPGLPVRLVRGSAYPWPVAPQQSRRPFQLIFLVSTGERVH
jgi:hypothetical protein